MTDNVIQNKIILGLIKEFEDDFSLPRKDEAKSFERMVNYVILSKIDPEAFSDPAVFDTIDVDKSGTFGIDAFALFVNDSHTTSKEEIELHRKSKRMDVRFVFVQTKRSTSVDAGEVLKFTAAVRNIFSATPSIPVSEDLQGARELINEVFKPDNARFFAHRRPRCELYFATAGSPIADPTLQGVLQSEEKNIHISVPEVQSVSIRHIGADFVIDSYNEIENRITVSITFEKCVPCERITDVEQAFIGYLPAVEFLKLITGSDGALRRNIFYENVRDFQGVDNAVNSEIAETLQEEEMLDKFILLNNGVTIVAREFTNIRSTEYEVSDYFVVNGCQTSNMIFRHRDRIARDSKLRVPIKLIHTSSNDLIAKLIRSTNRQTPVPDEAFVSLLKFHKRLQEFYRIYSVSSPEALYYERRSKEFSGAENKVEKFRIVNLHAQIRAFTAVMLNEPQLVMSNHPSSILNAHRPRLFSEDHKQLPYFLSTLFLRLFHRMDDEGHLDRRYVISRYWVCWIARVIASGRLDMGPMNSNRIDKDCEKIIEKLRSDEYVRKMFAEAVKVFEQTRSSHSRAHGTYRVGELIRLKTFRDEVRVTLVNRL